MKATPQDLREAAADFLQQARGLRIEEGALLDNVVNGLRNRGYEVEGHSQVRPELVAMLDAKHLDATADAKFNTYWYRLTKEGRIHYFGTRRDKLQLFLEKRWLELLILFVTIAGVIATLVT